MDESTTLDFRLGEFSGPLDLLLSLLDEKKMDITQVSLSAVTEQYLSYLDTMEEERPEEMADFLVVATRLLLMKARTLLPQFAPEEEDESLLAAQLRLYKQFLAVARDLHRRWMSPVRSVFRVEPPRKASGFVPPNGVTVTSLFETMKKLIHRLAPPKPLPQTVIDRAVSMKEKISTIRTLLMRGEHVPFHTIIERRNTTDIIVTFLALLELMKQMELSLHQEETFSDILISPSRV